MEIILWDYTESVLLQEGESPNHAILRAGAEGLPRKHVYVDTKEPYDATPATEGEYRYMLRYRRNKPMVEMQPQKEDAHGLVTDRRGNTIMPVTGRQRFTLDSEKRSYFPILEQREGVIRMKRVIFVSSLIR